MKISFIVPVYNVKKYIAQCIESIQAIEYKDIEIIIVNDGSTDDSGKLVHKMESLDTRITVVDQKNAGLSAARNTGIQEATGDYILFVDGDDWINPECVSDIVPYLNKKVDIVMFDFVREYGDKSKISKQFEQNEILFDKKKIQKIIRRLVGPMGRNELRKPHQIEDINVVCCKAYKTSLIKNIEFVDTKIIGTEDLWFNLQAFQKAYTACYKNVYLYHYNKLNDYSLTQVYNNVLFDRWKVLYSYIDKYMYEYNISGDRALKNRQVIELFTLTRNVAKSNLSYKEKKIELNKILKDDMYISAFQGFEFQNLPITWGIFFHCCKSKRINIILLMLKIGEKIRKVV